MIPTPLIPAKAGTQDRSVQGWPKDLRRSRHPRMGLRRRSGLSWIPAFAGMGGRVAVVVGFTLAATTAFAQGDAAKGQAVFQDACSGCHVLTGPGFSAPALSGVYGRKAGTADFQYSDAMKKSGIVWNDASLSSFLSDPSKAVPGTAMTYSLSDAQQRDDVVAYLRTLSPGAK